MLNVKHPMKGALVALLASCCLLTNAAFACQVVRGNGWESCVDAPTRDTVWHSRWGAIASDKDNGAFGASDTVSDKQRAQKKAIKACRKNKGVNCELRLTYYNGCASIASGKQWEFYQSEKSREQAISLGLQRCSQEDSECKITYVACSHAVGY